MNTRSIASLPVRLSGFAWGSCKLAPLVGLGFSLIVLALWLAPAPGVVAALSGGVTLLLLALAVGLRDLARAWHARAVFSSVEAMVEWERYPAYTADDNGTILWRNAEAERAPRVEAVARLRNVLDTVVADPGKLITDLHARARAHGHARESRSTSGRLVTFSVLAGPNGRYLWRLDQGPATADRGIEAVPVPGLRATVSGRVLAVNAALQETLRRPILRLGDVIGDLPLLDGANHTLLGANGPVPVQVRTARTDDHLDVFVLPPAGGQTQPDTTALFEELPVPLLKLDSDGGIAHANRSARELLDDDIPAGRRLTDLLSGLGRPVDDWLTEAREGRGLHQSEFLQVKRQPRDVFVQVTLKPLPEDDDAALIAVLNDATELKTLEAQFVQSQKMQAIGQLAGGVAHDFNNLLTAISGHCDLLLLRHDQGDLDYGDLVQIHQNANRAGSLVGQLLAFSRKQTLQPEVVDLRDALSDLTHLLNRLVGERITLSLQHDPGLAPIRADKRQLEQVIMNLVVNARDAMPDGGEITISTSTETLDHEKKLHRAAIPIGSYSVVRVTDHGCGIPPEKLSKVFEPFYTTKRTGEGTGLGLSTAYGIVKQTGGFIFIESEVGKGTTFTLYFPAHRAIDPMPIAPAAAEPGEGLSASEGVVLLVEDEAPVRAFASRALQLRGFTVIEAEDAETALETLEDGSLQVDVFVTDVVMPGMDGPTWVQEALKARPDTKVVFVSGYAEDALADHKSRIPNSVFLPKPFSLNDLTRTVQKQLTVEAA